MRHPLAILALALLTACGSSCGASPPAQGPGPHGGALTTGVFHFTPRAESTNVGPVGTGNARCGLYVYTWEPGAAACKVQVNHCSLDPHGETVCLSLADERTVPCGATIDACGQAAQCDCPVGPAQPVPDPPGTVHVNRDAVGQSFGDARCTARVTTIPGGPPPAPCILALHECEGAACNDRTVMVDCGGRSTECGTPWKCDCPADAAPAPPAAPPPIDPSPTACTANADCILSTYADSCCCACTGLHAVNAAYEAGQRQRAARVHCNTSHCGEEQCTPCGSTPPTARAACVAGACTVVSTDVEPGTS